MKKLVLAAVLAAIPMSAEAAVRISFTGTEFGTGTAFTGFLTIDTAKLAAIGNAAVPPYTSYYSATGLLTASVTYGGTTYTLAGDALDGDIYSSPSDQDGIGVDFDQQNSDPNPNGSFVYVTNDGAGVGATNAFDSVWLPDLRAVPNLALNFAGVNGTSQLTLLGLISVGANGYSIVGSTVPEPQSWAMMVLGFGFVGGAIRRRKVSFAAA